MNVGFSNFVGKFLLQIFIIALFVSGTNVTSAATDVSSNQIYTNDRFGYQISYPKSWKKSDEESFLDEVNKMESRITLYEKDKKYSVTITVDRNAPTYIHYLNEKVTTVLIGSTSTVAYINPLPGPCIAKGVDCSYVSSAINYNGLWYRFSAQGNVTMALDVYKDILASFTFAVSKKSDTQKLKAAKKAEKKIDLLMKKLKKTADKDVKEYYKSSEMENAVNAMYGYIGTSKSSHLCGHGYTNRTLFPVGSQITCSDVFAPYAVKVSYTNELNVTKYWCIDSSGAKRFKIKTDPAIAHDTNCDDDDVDKTSTNKSSSTIDSNDNSSDVITATILNSKSPLNVLFNVDYIGLGNYWIEFGDATKSDFVKCVKYKPDTDACLEYKTMFIHTYTKPGTYIAQYVNELIGASGRSNKVLGSVKIIAK